MLEVSGVPQQRPSWTGRRAIMPAHHGLGHHDQRRDPLGLIEQPGVQYGGELAESGSVAFLAFRGRPAGELGRAGQGQEMNAVLARHGHQRRPLVHVDVTPLEGRQPGPVRQQERHRAALLVGCRQPQSPRDSGDPTVCAEHPVRLDRLARVEHDAAHRVVGRARTDQRGNLTPASYFGAGRCRRIDQGRVEHDPPDAGRPVVTADRGEVSGHVMTEHSPAEVDHRQVMGGLERFQDPELLQALEGVGEHDVRRHGVAGEPVAIQQQHPPTGPG